MGHRQGRARAGCVMSAFLVDFMHSRTWLDWVVIWLAEIRLQEGESIESALRRFSAKFRRKTSSRKSSVIPTI
jgi:uncharacterized protein YqcC (DUF446 family)